MRPGRLMGLAGLLLALVACDQSAAPTDSASSTTSNGPATTTSAAADAAPAELAGEWRAELDNGDRVQLALRGTRYFLARGASAGSGDISVEGNVIVFSGSNLCDGVGTYEWTVQGDSLTFAPTESGEACSGRSVLKGVTYTR